MNKIPKTTLFMLSSLDGKISSGDTDKVDVDKDWKNIKGVKEGLCQYYSLEKKTDLVSFNTGKVMAKIGINHSRKNFKKIPVSFVLVDNKPHLDASGIKNLSDWLKHVFIVTTNKKHPAFISTDKLKNITVIYCPRKIDFIKLFEKLKNDFFINKMTVQSGGTMNATLLRLGLIDRISLVIAPLLVGGTTTPTIVDGTAVHSIKDLDKLKPLKLVKVNQLKNSYLHLIYKVLN